MINGCAVKHPSAEAQFKCQMVMSQRSGVRFKCGKCHRGNVYPNPGAKCRVCGAEVVWIDDGIPEKGIVRDMHNRMREILAHLRRITDSNIYGGAE